MRLSFRSSSALALLAGLAAGPLGCSEVGVDPDLPSPGNAAVAPAPAAGPLLDLGLSAEQQRALLAVLAGTTDADALDPAERRALQDALADARARLEAETVRQRAAVRSAELSPQEEAERLRQHEAFHAFSAAFLDRALHALG